MCGQHHRSDSRFEHAQQHQHGGLSLVYMQDGGHEEYKVSTHTRNCTPTLQSTATQAPCKRTSIKPLKRKACHMRYDYYQSETHDYYQSADSRIELAHEELCPQDGKDEEEHDADERHVGHCRHGEHHRLEHDAHAGAVNAGSSGNRCQAEQYTQIFHDAEHSKAPLLGGKTQARNQEGVDRKGRCEMCLLACQHMATAWVALRSATQNQAIDKLSPEPHMHGYHINGKGSQQTCVSACAAA